MSKAFLFLTGHLFFLIPSLHLTHLLSAILTPSSVSPSYSMSKAYLLLPGHLFFLLPSLHLTHLLSTSNSLFCVSPFTPCPKLSYSSFPVDSHARFPVNFPHVFQALEWKFSFVRRRGFAYITRVVLGQECRRHISEHLKVTSGRESDAYRRKR